MSKIVELEEAFTAFYPNSVAFSATRSMMERSNRTAFAEFRDVARESGVHDFADQRPGDRKYVPIDFLGKPEPGNEPQWTSRRMTLNITPSTREHRFWIERLTDLVGIDDILVVGFDRQEGVVGADLSTVGDVADLQRRIIERRHQLGTRTAAPIDRSAGGGLYEDLSSGNHESERPARYAVISRRIIRDTTLTKRVKELYDYHCQICGLRLLQANGRPYAEGAHIVPLSVKGPDTIENVLCLCPNHHVMLDSGAIYISDDLGVWDTHADEKIGQLQKLDSHLINESGFRVQRELYSEGPEQNEH